MVSSACGREQIALGSKVRALFESRGITSVAAEGFKAPGVVVSYTDDPGLQSNKKFLAEGLQTAAGVPLQCDEGSDFSTFASDSLGWRNGTTSISPCRTWRPRWIVWVLRRCGKPRGHRSGQQPEHETGARYLVAAVPDFSALAKSLPGRLTIRPV